MFYCKFHKLVFYWVLLWSVAPPDLGQVGLTVCWCQVDKKHQKAPKSTYLVLFWCFFWGQCFNVNSRKSTKKHPARAFLVIFFFFLWPPRSGRMGREQKWQRFDTGCDEGGRGTVLDFLGNIIFNIFHEAFWYYFLLEGTFHSNTRFMLQSLLQYSCSDFCKIDHLLMASLTMLRLANNIGKYLLVYYSSISKLNFENGMPVV